MKSVLLITLSLLLSLSCAQKSDQDVTTVTQYTSLSTHPIRIYRQIENCKKPLTQFGHRIFYLNLHLGGSYDKSRYNFSGAMIGDKLKSRDSGAISETLYGEETLAVYKANYDYETDVWDFGKPIDVENVLSSMEVEICLSENKYSNNSIEGAALAVNYTISKTNRAIKKLFPDLQIDPISVRIAPLFGTKILASNDYEQITAINYLTDNAYYDPKSKTIQFLPQSEEGLESDVYGGHSLWNIPMVGAHEYGHHLFSTIYPQGDELKQNSEHKHDLCFDNRIEKANKFANSKVSNFFRKVGSSDVLSALNEGFADLISYYGLNNKERSLEGVTCLEVNRDVGSKMFADKKTKKFFSDEALTSFFSFLGNDDARNCISVDFQDIHIMGAVFASSTDQLISKFSKSKKRKLKITIQWLKELHKKYSESEKIYPRAMMEGAFHLMISTVMSEFELEYLSPEHKKLCDTAAKLYPQLKKSSNNLKINKCYLYW